MIVIPASVTKFTVSAPVPLFKVVVAAELVLLIVKVLPPLPNEMFSALTPL